MSLSPLLRMSGRNIKRLSVCFFSLHFIAFWMWPCQRLLNKFTTCTKVFIHVFKKKKKTPPSLSCYSLVYFYLWIKIENFVLKFVFKIPPCCLLHVWEEKIKKIALPSTTKGGAFSSFLVRNVGTLVCTWVKSVSLIWEWALAPWLLTCCVTVKH